MNNEVRNIGSLWSPVPAKYRCASKKRSRRSRTVRCPDMLSEALEGERKLDDSVADQGDIDESDLGFNGCLFSLFAFRHLKEPESNSTLQL